MNHRRNFLHTAPFVAVAAIAPSRDWLLATLDATTPRPGGKVGHEQVAAIREAFAIYRETDVMRGGGHARRALAQYVIGHVLPLLRDADPDTGASLFTAASEQTYLLGRLASLLYRCGELCQIRQADRTCPCNSATEGGSYGTIGCVSARYSAMPASVMLGRSLAGAYGDDDPERPKLVAIAQQRATERTGVVFDNDTTILIGDTPHDVEAGLTSSVRVIGIATGKTSTQELRDIGAHHVAANLVECQVILNRLTQDVRHV